MALQEKLKTAMDETRLLILGAEVLAGFQFHSTFQDAFESLTPHARQLDAAAFLLMVVTIGLLIVPAMQHLLVEYSEATARIHRVTTICAGLALLPLGLALGLDLFVALEKHVGTGLASFIGAIFCLLALMLWYAAAWLCRRFFFVEKPMPKHEKTPLHTKIDQMLTESRVIIPGAQALLGFQMTVMLTSAFEKLPMSSKTVHIGALCCIALAIVLLMAPAAFHRIAFGGEDSEKFHRIGTVLVTSGALPLAMGISADLYVAIAKAIDSPAIAMVMAAVTAMLLMALWYVQPLLLRRTVQP